MENVAVFGTGVLGSQIMMQAAYHGKSVVGYDVSQELLDKLPARWEWMRTYYERDVEDFSEEKFSAAIARISTTTDATAAVRDADIVIEAIPENLDLKRTVWAQIGRDAPKHTVFTTNTSTLLPSDFADASGAPERFLALHFANYVWRQNTGEVMGHAGTSPEYVDAVVAFAEEIGLMPVRLRKEQPGYIVNSLLVPWLEAAMRLYMGGVASPEDIDKDWRTSTGAPRGPFEVYDTVGFGVAVNIFRNDADDPEKQEWADLLERELEAGRSGLAAGHGFYRYDADGSSLGPSEHLGVRD